MATKLVDLAEAREKLPELIDLARSGDEVIITSEERQVARLVPLHEHKKKKRIAGLNRGQVWMSDDFDAPLPDEFWLGEE